MSKPGRELELLIAKLEALAAPYPVDVQSPARILDHRTGGLREVDVALRGSLGSLDLLVIFECRDRAGSEDVRWIEELLSKGQSVHANKVVAVSSSGFSRGARRLADSTGVSLHTVGDLKAGDVASWLQLIHLQVELPQFVVDDVQVTYWANMPDLSPRAQKALEGDLDYRAPVFGLPLPGEHGTWSRLVDLDTVRHAACGPISMRLTLPDGATEQRISLLASDQERPFVAIETTAGMFPLATLRFVGTYSVETVRVPPTRMRSYDASKGGNLAQVVDFDFTANGDDYTASFIKQADGRVDFELEEVGPTTG